MTGSTARRRWTMVGTAALAAVLSAGIGGIGRPAGTVLRVEAAGSENNEDLFSEYARRAFEDSVSDQDAAGIVEEDNRYEAPRYNRLTYKEKTVYLQLKKACRDIADGRRSDTFIQVDWGSGSFNNDNFSNVVEALLTDCPYEMYWYNKEDGAQLWNSSIGFRVDPYYSKTGGRGTFETDTSKTGLVQSSISNAKAIAAQAAGMSDYDALHYFKDQICDLVEYDDEALYYSSSVLNDDNPWQMIYVFDGDPSTDVVCEGYSKAFKYLCDLYGFTTSSTDCYIVMGTIYDSQGNGGAHMWNMVHWSDGRNYMVDVTNCDGADDPDCLFLVGSSDIDKDYVGGSYRTIDWWKDGLCWDYYFYFDDGTAFSDTLQMFTESEVGIASQDLARSNRKHGAIYPNGMGWLNDRGDSYWYEYGVRQGTLEDSQGVWYDGSNRGREIYDPSSNGWYWLDSIYDGAKAIDKEVLIPYVFHGEETMSDAEMRQHASASDAGMQDYVYQVEKSRSGKWVRYDHEGKMMKGWVTISGSLAALYPSQVGNTYYYDHQTGLMAKGWITLGGRTYHFDEESGRLLN